MLKVLAGLALASGGDTVKNSVSASHALLSSLNPIPMDRLEYLSSHARRIKGGSDALAKEAVEERQRIERRQPSLSADQRGSMNRMLLLAPVPDGDHEPDSGNIYLQKGWKKQTESPFSRNGITSFRLVEDICDIEEKDKVREVAHECLPFIIEITPACDYSQSKARFSRCVAGLFIPEKYSKKIKGAPFVKNVGLVHLKNAKPTPFSGNYCICLNAHYLVGLSLVELSKQKARFRVRKQVLVDIQSWFASHAARPGMLSL